MRMWDGVVVDLRPAGISLHGSYERSIKRRSQVGVHALNHCRSLHIEINIVIDWNALEVVSKDVKDADT